MSEEISFKDNIEQVKAKLETARAELEELEQKYHAYDLKTEKTRESLKDLRRILEGRLPEGHSSTSSVGDIPKVDINPESGRPSRGARREQLEQICRKIGARQDEFRTVDVLNVLREVEGELTDGMKSYTYAVMTTLQDEGLVEKIGRGKWKLA